MNTWTTWRCKRSDAVIVVVSSVKHSNGFIQTFIGGWHAGRMPVGAILQEASNQRGPASLMTCPQPATGVAVEVSMRGSFCIQGRDLTQAAKMPLGVTERGRQEGLD